MTFGARLDQALSSRGSLCVGIDPHACPARNRARQREIGNFRHQRVQVEGGERWRPWTSVLQQVPHDLIQGKALYDWWSRAPTDVWNIVTWFKSIRWNRFFKLVR